MKNIPRNALISGLMMVWMSLVLIVVSISGVAAWGETATSGPSTAPAKSSDPGAASSLTAADAKITDEISKRISEAMTGPMIGKGIQVLTTNGKVVLRGTAKNPGEKDSIGVIAGKVAGAENVTNNIECANEH